ncbi:hypothetical protein MMC31_007680 [Peltigera leucophlebia]|nr:hypothetical protein [Peltigera leucophlebia]
MACLESVERNSLENKPERLNTTPTSFPNPSTQHNHDLHTRPTPKLKSKGQTNSGSAQPGASAFSRTMPSLDPKHFHILWTSNYALEFKVFALRSPWDIFKFFTSPFQNAVFQHAIEDMTKEIFITPHTKYVLERAMEKQMKEHKEEALKAYLRLMDSQFPVLLASGRKAFAATPPTTPVSQSKFQSVNTTPDTNHIANSVTGTLDNVLPRMKDELQGQEVTNLSLNAFLKHFITLEDAPNTIFNYGWSICELVYSRKTPARNRLENYA